MHAISGYRGNRPTNTPTNRQGRLQYTVQQLVCSVTTLTEFTNSSTDKPRHATAYSGDNSCTQRTPKSLTTLTEDIILTFIYQDNLGKSVPECLHTRFCRAKDNGGGGDNWSYKMHKAPVNSSLSLSQQTTFYRPDEGKNAVIVKMTDTTTLTLIITYC